MNAYTTFIKSICSDKSTIESHLLFYIRMELGLCKLQLNKDLFIFEKLRLEYQKRFSNLSGHIIDLAAKFAHTLDLSITDFENLSTVYTEIDYANFDKEKLDIAIAKLNTVFDKRSLGISYTDMEIKVLNLSA